MTIHVDPESKDGAGDLTILLIDVGHDVRAARVLLGRLSARAVLQQENDGRDI